MESAEGETVFELRAQNQLLVELKNPLGDAPDRVTLNCDMALPVTINQSTNEKEAPAATTTPLITEQLAMTTPTQDDQLAQHNEPPRAPSGTGTIAANPASARSRNYYHEYGQKILANGYRVIPIKPRDKVPAQCVLTTSDSGIQRRWEGLRRWRDKGTLDTELAKLWEESGVGIITGKVVAIDIDITDPIHALVAQDIVTEYLGPTPLIRVGQAPKLMMLYKTAKPFGKLSRGKIEALCDGQMFVAFGIHPKTGQPYPWVSGEDPTTVHVDDLPEVTEEQVRKLMGP